MRLNFVITRDDLACEVVIFVLWQIQFLMKSHLQKLLSDHLVKRVGRHHKPINKLSARQFQTAQFLRINLAM